MDRRTLQISLLDGLVGVVIGSVSMATLNLRYPGRGLDDFELLAAVAGVSAFLFGGAFFLATATLAPFLIRWLRSRLDLPRRAYYRAALGGGIAFGIAASAAVGLFFPLTLALWPNVPDFQLAERVLLTLLGPLLLVPGSLLTALFLFGIELLVFGVAFGLFNGWLVRRTFGASAA